jgi:hypothetical protein
MTTTKTVAGQRCRRLAAAAGLLAAAGLTTTSCAGGHVAGVKATAPPMQLAAADAAALADSTPGTDPGIQRWFKDDEKARIRFDNDLLKAERDIAAASGTTNCSALLTSTATVRADLARLRGIKNGGPAIADAYTPPFEKFSKAATACVHKDYATARSVLGDTAKGAIADFGEAQETVDEILDGGA